MTNEFKHIIMDLINSGGLPEYFKTSLAVKFINHKDYKRKQLYKKRLELKGKRIGSGTQFAFPVKELIKLKTDLINSK